MFQVGLPDNDSAGQVFISKTASTIVRNSNSAVAVNYANDSISPLKTASIVTDGYTSLPPIATNLLDKITGERLMW